MKLTEQQFRKYVRRLVEEVMKEGQSEAAKEAKQKGLVSKGWGRWADPKTGKIVAQTMDGKLEWVDPRWKPERMKPRVKNYPGNY